MTAAAIRRAALVVLALLGAALAPGCKHERGVVLWHSYRAKERVALDALAAEWNRRHPDQPLELVAVPNETFPDKITTAIPRGHGPDLVIFAHDRLGDWVESGLVEPLEFFADDALCDRYIAPVLDAMTYGGSLYGLPLAFKSTALFYNRKLVPRPPATTDELLQIGRALTDRGAGRFGLVYPWTKLYFHAAWLHGFGGSVFGAGPGASGGALDLLGPGALESLAFVRSLAGVGGIMPAEVEGHLVAAMFNDGRAAMAVSGPWFLGEIKGDVDFAVAPLPTVSATGRPAAPFLGVEGIMMSSRAHDKATAFEVMRFFTSDEAALVRARQARQTVANVAAYGPEGVRDDAVIMAFRDQAELAIPMPARPEMRMVWTPYDKALTAALAGGKDARGELEKAQKEILGYLAGSGR